MKKIIVAIVAMIFLIGCGSTKKTDQKGVVATTVSTTSTTVVATDNVEEASKCASDGTNLMTQWVDVRNKIQEAKAHGVYSIKEASRADVNATRNWIVKCEKYFPEWAGEFDSLLEKLAEAITTLEKGKK